MSACAIVILAAFFTATLAMAIAEAFGVGDDNEQPIHSGGTIDRQD